MELRRRLAAAGSTVQLLDLCAALSSDLETDYVEWATAMLDLELDRHRHRSVRREVAAVLMIGGDSDRRSAERLTALTRDRVCLVRDWATTALASLEADTAEVRDALARMLADADDGTRCEALVGLARRGDPRALTHLLARRGSDTLFGLELAAAAVVASPELHAWLDGWSERWLGSDGSLERAWRLARDRCAPGASDLAAAWELELVARRRLQHDVPVERIGSYPRTLLRIHWAAHPGNDYEVWPGVEEVDWADYRPPGRALRDRVTLVSLATPAPEGSQASAASPEGVRVTST